MSKVSSFSVEDGSAGERSKKKRNIIIIGVVVVICCVALIVGLSVGLTNNNSSSSQTTTTSAPTTPPVTPEEARRIDCYPEASSPQEEVDKAKCEARGCEYSPSSHPAVPACYWPKDGPNTGLKVLAEESLVDGRKWTLQIKQGSKLFSSEITTLNFTVRELSDNILQFKVSWKKE